MMEYLTKRNVAVNIIVYMGLCVNYPQLNPYRFTFDATDQLILLLIIVIFNLGLKYISNYKVSHFKYCINTIFSLIYSAFIVLGRSYSARGNLSLLWQDRMSILGTFISWLSTGIILLCLTLVLAKFFNKKKNLASNVNHTWSLRTIWFLSFLVILILWLPYIILCSPGLFSWDGMEQMNELFQIKAPVGQFVLTNHHPVFITLIEGAFLKIGIELFHSVNAGLLLNQIALNLLTISGFATLITVVYKECDIKYCYCLMAFFGLFPIFPIWASAFDKTGYFTAFIIFLIADILYLDFNKPSILPLFLLFICSLFVGLTRNDGIIYTGFLLVGSLTLKKRRNIILTLLISMVCIGVSSNLIQRATKALPTEPMESMAIPMQQMGRVIKYNPKSISKDEKKTLNKFFVYSNIAKRYDPEFADNVKMTSRWPYLKFKVGKNSYRYNINKFNNQPFVKDKTELRNCYFQLGKHNKRLYLEALVAQNIYYVYPQNHPSHFPWISGFNKSTFELTKLTKQAHQNFPKGFSLLLVKPLGILTTLPIINLLFITFGWFVIWTSASLGLLDQNKYRFLNLILLGVGVVCVSLISPVNGYMRYYFPLMVLSPVLWCLAISRKKSK